MNLEKNINEIKLQQVKILENKSHEKINNYMTEDENNASYSKINLDTTQNKIEIQELENMI